MALCCIGGVCIPYSALLPLVIWGLRWLIEKLAGFGLLPKSLESWLLTTLQIQPKKSASAAESDCCKPQGVTCNSASNTPSGLVGEVQNAEDWKVLLQSNEIVVAKFTATWCSPCKTIQPTYVSLASEHHNAKFVTVDADNVDDVANGHNVAILPTFLVVRNGAVVERYSGSDENKLRAFMQDHVAERVE